MHVLEGKRKAIFEMPPQGTALKVLFGKLNKKGNA